MTTSTDSRDALPDYIERTRRLPSIWERAAFPLIELAIELDFPVSTLDKLRALGRGPKTFKIGRRLYTTPAWSREWIEELKAEGGELSAPKRQKRAAA